MSSSQSGLIPTPLPDHTADMVRHLDRNIPPVTIQDHHDLVGEDRKLALAYQAGRRSVVDRLLQLLEEDQATV